jgi:hypothetical protein
MHSPEQMRKKNEDRAESLSHYGSNVSDMRGGMNHDAHKMREMEDHADEFRGKGMMRQSPAEESREHGYPVKTGESC